MGRKTNDTSSISEVWIAFWESEGHSVPHFQKLCEHYLFLVDIVAHSMQRSGTPVELEDLRSMGFVGLMDAVRAYSPLHGAAFGTFAPRRIRGAIYDGLRYAQGKFAPRLNMTRAKLVNRVREDFYKTHGRNPSYDEVAEELRKRNVQNIPLILGDCTQGVMESLYTPQFETDSGKTLSSVDMISDALAEDPQGHDPMETIKILCKGMPEQHKQIVVDYYMYGHNMKKIAKKNGCSESNVSIIIGEALETMRSRVHLIS